MTIHVVYDNYVSREGLQPKWGFGAFVETVDQTVLFDTGGDGGVLLRNMAALDLDPGAIDLIVLSHEHWDHIGGLASILGTAKGMPVCVPASFSAKFKNGVAQAGSAVREVTDAAELAPGVHSTGDIRGPIREQALVLRSRDGLVVLTGCAHPGIVEMTRAARKAAPGGVLFVGGGFHLKDAKDRQIAAAIAALRELGVQSVGPSHCTGDRAIRAFYEEFGSSFVQMGVGRLLRFDD
jgi:7,8-dihydropterin-6-yl-methyl-4-(beta-D-ribofuranosyl)aminobenzene 5'-phosphate synthase